MTSKHIEAHLSPPPADNRWDKVITRHKNSLIVGYGALATVAYPSSKLKLTSFNSPPRFTSLDSFLLAFVIKVNLHCPSYFT